MPPFKRGQQGVNLVEVLVTLTIVSLSLTFGVPAFESLRLKSDRSSAMMELMSAATLARSEAALRGTPVTVCASTDGEKCSGTSDWSRGWIVFQDPDRELSFSDGANVLHVTRFPAPSFTLTADDNIGAGITFGLFGFPQPSSGILTYTDSVVSRRIQLTHVGRLNVSEVSPETSG
jgi:type IV fimbrial biogenesis protein FimT